MTEGRNYRVEYVIYSHDLESDSRRFVNGFRQVIHLGGFHCILDADSMMVYPERDFESVDELQVAIASYLRGWELHSELHLNCPLRFRKTTHLIRSLDTGAQGVGIGTAREHERAQPITAVAITDRVGITDMVIVEGDRIGEPEIRSIEFSESVEAARDRWRDVVDGRERLLVGGYWFLSHLETHFGARKAAATGLRVAPRVLDTIGMLTAINDPNEGRKRSRKERELLTEVVRIWLMVTIPKVIYRFAEVESGHENLPQITMQDLPFLEL